MTRRERARALLDRVPRPLDPMRSIKLKIAAVVLVSWAAAFTFFRIRIGWLAPTTVFGALGIALAISQVVGHGMTRPLREMTWAVGAMRRGDYSRRVRATGRDEVGQLAVAFNEMAADIADAEQRRRELIANVSHELRTPITALQAVLENVVDGVERADATTMRTALAQTERLGRLVAELLDLSRIDAGAHRLDLSEVDVPALLGSAVAEAAVAAPSTRFAVDAPPGTAVTADRARLHQVVQNLLDNATRHAPPDGEVRITARADGDLFALAVEDDGPGIAEADRERVFERFTRGERASGGGTGLGLDIARWVVDLHGGAIRVVDAPGCRIEVTLPRSGRPPTG